MRSASIALTAMFIAGLTTPASPIRRFQSSMFKKARSLARFGIVSPKTMKLSTRAWRFSSSSIEGESYKESLPTMLQSRTRVLPLYIAGAVG